MLRRQQRIRTQFFRLLDAGIFASSFWFAHWLRSHVGDFGGWMVQLLARVRSEPEILPFDTFFPLFFLVIPLSLFFLESHQFYQREWLPSRRRVAWQLLQVSFLVTAGLIIAMFVLKLPSARGVVILFGVVSFIAMIVRDELYRGYLKARARNGELKKHLMILGTAPEIARVREELEAKSASQADIVDEVDIEHTPIERFIERLHHRSPNGVVIAGGRTPFNRIERFIHACELEGVEVWFLADFIRTTICRTTVDEFYGRPMLVFHSGPELSWRSVLKRVLDFAAALVLVIVLLPLFIAVAALIRVTSPGPVLYRDRRCGLNGRPFVMYKFRSMILNAEALRAQMAPLNELNGPAFKVTNDPRVTRWGVFLRKYSIDELPQLFNVLKGQMSLVGPRPLIIGEVQQFYDLAHRRRLSVKPGLTCLWQINGRSNLREFNDWMRMDLDYIDRWSLWLDLKILARTIPVVLSGTGAK